MALNKKNIRSLFYIFLTVHLILWTLVPSVTNDNLPLDTIEALAWGSNLDWGFNKHPPMSAFVIEFFYLIFGSNDWAYYLLSQIFVVVSFFLVFKFTEDFFSNKVFSLLSVLLLEGIYFYNFTSPEFNVNVCLMPFWALTVLYLWKGFKNNKIIDWLLFGLFAGFGFLSKYLFIYLGLAADIFLIYMIFNKKIDLKCVVSIIPFLIIIFSHLIWLVENDYITITYGLHRAGNEGQNVLNNIVFPVIFFGKQLGILIPFFIMVLLLVSKIKTKFNFKDEKLLYLLAVNLIPIILIFLTSVLMGVKIRTMWMTPFYLFFGVLFVYIFQNQIKLKKIQGFILTFIILFIFSPFMYAYVSLTKDDKRTDYPGKQIAELVERRWSKNFSNEIMYVIGDEWYAGNLSYHLPSRPMWFNSIKDKAHKLDVEGGVVYTGNHEVLKNICPGEFGKIDKQGFCMIGTK